MNVDLDYAFELFGLDWSEIDFLSACPNIFGGLDNEIVAPVLLSSQALPSFR